MNTKAQPSQMKQRFETLFTGLEEDTLSRLDAIAKAVENLSQMVSVQMMLQQNDASQTSAIEKNIAKTMNAAVSTITKADAGIAKVIKEAEAKEPKPNPQPDPTVGITLARIEKILTEMVKHEQMEKPPTTMPKKRDLEFIPQYDELGVLIKIVAKESGAAK